MKKARTKKARGLKRKAPRSTAKARDQQRKKNLQAVQRTTEANEQLSRNLAEQLTKAKFAAKKVGQKNVAQKNVEKKERRAPASNVLKANNPRHQTQSSASTGSADPEVERWVSLIREGEFDRKVKVKGKTGALLVR